MTGTLKRVPVAYLLLGASNLLQILLFLNLFKEKMYICKQVLNMCNIQWMSPVKMFLQNRMLMG